jgi:hypothetical protein
MSSEPTPPQPQRWTRLTSTLGAVLLLLVLVTVGVFALLAHGGPGNWLGDSGPTPTATAEPTETATLEPTSTPTAIPTATPVPSPTPIPNYLGVTISACSGEIYPTFYVRNLYPSQPGDSSHIIDVYITVYFGSTRAPWAAPVLVYPYGPSYRVPVDVSPFLEQRNYGAVRLSLRAECDGPHPTPSGSWSGALQPCA